MKHPPPTPTPAEKALLDLLVMLANNHEAHRLLLSTKQGVTALQTVGHLLKTLPEEESRKLREPVPLTMSEADEVAKAALEEMYDAAKKVRALEKKLAEQSSLMAEYRQRLERIYIPGF